MILQTRLQMPPLRATRIHRNRLIRKLNHITESKLALIVAPAGFGKTTLVCDWSTQSDMDVAWLSLHGLDLTYHEFMLYLIESIRTIQPDIGEAALTLLHSSDSTDTKQILTSLINDLLTLPSPIVMTFDDYHVLAQQESINRDLSFLIQNAPHHIHFMMISRTMPDLNVARLRSQAQVIDITSAELRFTAIEAQQFLTDVVHVQLSDTQRLRLESKTEGWVTGLQLAGNSMLYAHDVDAYIQAFSGQTQPIRQYLLEEVFQQQSDDIRNFLIATSCLDGLCADLCNTLLNITNSQGILTQLDTAQLFIVPQDYEQQWYAYHGIFKDFLAPFFDAQPDDKKQRLYHRASQWYEAHNNIQTAIRYAILSKDDEQVARLLGIWLAREDWVQHDMYRLETWFKALPQSIIEKHIDLYFNYLWLKLEVYQNPWDDIVADVKRIHTLLDINNANYSPHDILLFSAQADMLMINHARFHQEYERGISLCKSILEKLPEDEYYMRGGTIAHMASIYEALEDFQNASQFYKEAIVICQSCQNIDGLLFASWKLMELLILLNDLPQAQAVYDDLDGYHDSRTGPDMGAILIALGEVYRRMNYLSKAQQPLEHGIRMCEPFPAWQASTTLGKKRIEQLQQQTPALDALTERELETLQFLQSDLSINDIADQLSVSISTIRTYCKRIYNKLHVHSRAEAVFRARELNIL